MNEQERIKHIKELRGKLNKYEKSRKANPYIYRTYTVQEYSIECPWCHTINGGLSHTEIYEGTTIRCSYCYKLIKVMELKP